MTTNKPQKEYLYKLKRSTLTLKDMKTMWAIRQGEMNDKDIIEWFDKVVEGGVEHIPLSEFGTLYGEIYEQFYEVDDPKDETGKASNSV
jgi:hypothetical protein